MVRGSAARQNLCAPCLGRLGTTYLRGIGADPQRLNHFIEAFAPTCNDLSDDNNRSNGTDIAVFGNDVLRGYFRQADYRGIERKLYPANEGQAYSSLVSEVYSTRKRLVETGRRDWCLAVLVPTKKLMQVISDVFSEPPAGMTAIATPPRWTWKAQF